MRWDTQMSVSATALIEMLKPDAPDRAVAKLVALYLLESDRHPYWFSINHDIRPPAMKRCPIEFDWALGDHVGIKTNIRPRAEKWIIDDALAGYRVSREGRPPALTLSLAVARAGAAYAQRPRVVYGDDDIPF